MFVLERLHADHVRKILVSPDRAVVSSLLADVFRDRASLDADNPESEHLRAAAYRLDANPETFDGIMTLAGEVFRIRHDPEETQPSPTGRRLRKRLVRNLRATADKTWVPSNAALAVQRANAEEDTFDVRPAPLDEEFLLDGEAFEIGRDQ